MMNRISMMVVAGTIGGLLNGSVLAATTVVTSLNAAFVANGQWFTALRGNGTAGIVDLTGAGGNLENNAPLPTGAVQLTTGFSNSDGADVAVQDDFGKVSDVLSTLNLSYSYHKATVAGGNAFAAPSLKLGFFNPASTGTGINRGFVQLIYEPTWNQPGNGGSSVAVPTDQWTGVNIDQDNGLFWATGGFGQANSAGGPPLRTLAQWASAFNSEFQGATLFQVGVGVGTFNQGQLGFTDAVGISHRGLDRTYNFQVVPVPGAVWMGAALMSGLGLTRLVRRRLN